MKSVALAIAVAGVPTILHAAQSDSVSLNGEHPSARAARIESGEAPNIDGDLSDASWAKSTIIDDFKQRQPFPGEPPTERTVVRIMYDSNNLYFSIYAYDSEPDRLVVRSMSRDGQLTTGDHIQLTLDPGLTRRNAYVFMIGPSGGRWDGLRLNNQEELPEWDTIWSGRARRVTDGWVAEVAIPFRSISYEENQQEGWGFDFTRVVRRKAETLRWSSINPALQLSDVSESGTLTGISDVNQGLGLDIAPYIALRAKHDWSLPGDGAGLSATVGGNAFYKITPALTGTLTFNPDFSDAPLDSREVNTTRFSLFLPETRDFFLQDAGSFEFGGRPFRRTSFDRQRNNGRPFFSRNLGLVNGQPVSLIAGGKLSGEVGGFNVGALSVYTDDTPTAPGQVLSVARVTKQVFSESRLGIIFTNGDPKGLSSNSVAGADFQYRDTTTFGGDTIQADAYYERSYSSKAGNDDSYGIDFNFPNEPWNAEFLFKTVGENFTPALGFVNRQGVRLYDISLGHFSRNPTPLLRSFEVNTRNEIITNLSGLLESRESRLQIQFETRTDHSVSADVVDNFDRLDLPFALPHNVIIPAGTYDWFSMFVHVRTTQAVPLSLHLDAWCCAYYNGNEIRVREEFSYKPSAVFEFELDHDGTYIRMPSGNVDIHILSFDGIVNFAPDMQLAFQTQYDNISQGFGFLARYRWEFRPGSEILFSAGQTALIPGSQFQAKATIVSLRITHTLQF